MRSIRFLWGMLILTFFLNPSCKRSAPRDNFSDLTSEFLAQYIPEMQETRLLQKSDLDKRQQQFFDEAKGQLQLLADLNQNGTPEYIVTGVSDYNIRTNQKKKYFIAIFERKNDQVERLYYRDLMIPPVNLELTEDSGDKRVIISFAFYSGYGASLYFADSTYTIEQW